MDWIVKCRYVKVKNTNKLKREIIRICPKCKDKRIIDFIKKRRGGSI